MWHTDFVQDVTILCYCWLHSLNDGRDYQIWCSYPSFSIHIPFCIGVYYGSSFVVKKITALIIQYRAITYFLVYSSLGMFSTHLLLFYLGNEAYRNTTERYYGNTLTDCARFPLLNVLVYGKILISLHRKGYRIKVAKFVLLYFTGRLAYFLLCEKENNMM